MPSMTSDDAPVLLWFRNDLRLADQAALHAAVETRRPILPVYVLDDQAPERWALGGASRWWLHHSLAALRDSLSRLGGGLTLRRGESVAVITDLAKRIGATAVFTGGSADPWMRRVDKAVSEALGGELHRMRTTTLFHPESVRTKTGGAYSVYTPFAKACLALGGPKPPLPAPPTYALRRPRHRTDWRIGGCCRPSRTGPAGCAPPGAPARPARALGRRRS